jgi:hypothetical protein
MSSFWANRPWQLLPALLPLGAPALKLSPGGANSTPTTAARAIIEIVATIGAQPSTIIFTNWLHRQCQKRMLADSLTQVEHMAFIDNKALGVLRQRQRKATVHVRGGEVFLLDVQSQRAFKLFKAAATYTFNRRLQPRCDQDASVCAQQLHLTLDGQILVIDFADLIAPNLPYRLFELLGDVDPHSWLGSQITFHYNKRGKILSSLLVSIGNKSYN